MRRVLIALIEMYQRYVSPLKRPTCRFLPTCSEYAREAIGRFGVVRGTLMALFRLGRCHPLCKGGYDPVPEAPARGALPGHEEARP